MTVAPNPSEVQGARSYFCLSHEAALSGPFVKLDYYLVKPKLINIQSTKGMT